MANPRESGRNAPQQLGTTPKPLIEIVVDPGKDQACALEGVGGRPQSCSINPLRGREFDQRTCVECVTDPTVWERRRKKARQIENPGIS